MKKDIQISSEDIKLLNKFNNLMGDEYSDTFELIDAIPIFVYSKRLKKNEKGILLPIKRTFVFKNNSFNVTIDPVYIEQKNKGYKLCFASKREELVLETLKKIASEKEYVEFKDIHTEKITGLGVYFNLFDIERELKKNGHSMKSNDIKQSLIILSKTKVDIKGGDVSVYALSPNIIKSVAFSKGKGRKNSNDKCFVIFNDAVLKSIEEKNYNSMNYNSLVSCNSFIGRWLIRRISHNFRQADYVQHRKFSITLLRILRDFGGEKYERLKRNHKQVIEALEDLKKIQFIIGYTIEEIYSPLRKNVLVDVKYTLHLHTKTINEIHNSNIKKKIAVDQFFPVEK